MEKKKESAINTAGPKQIVIKIFFYYAVNPILICPTLLLPNVCYYHSYMWFFSKVSPKLDLSRMSSAVELQFCFTEVKRPNLFRHGDAPVHKTSSVEDMICQYLEWKNL